MNAAEAIKIINGRIEFRKQEYSDVASEYIEALELAVEALRKQTPVKPIYDHRYAELGCAFCGNMVSGWEELLNYCPYCGQAIDWEVEE